MWMGSEGRTIKNLFIFFFPLILRVNKIRKMGGGDEGEIFPSVFLPSSLFNIFK